MRIRPPRPVSMMAEFSRILLLTAGLLVGGSASGQRAVDSDHPLGRWEVLDRCRLAEGPVDGDSFRILHRGREYGVRLYFVDAPETDPNLTDRVQDQATYFGIALKDVPRAGEIAGRFTRDKLAGREFTVQTRWQNALGRGNVARFYGEVLADGKNLGEELVAHGLARIYGPKVVRPDGTRASTVINLLKNLEISAREKRLGVWETNQFPRAAGKGLSASPLADGNVLDLNTASYEQLQTLPGIGKKLAERIIAHRPYKSVDELEKVPGFGRKMIAKLKPLVRAGNGALPRAAERN